MGEQTSLFSTFKVLTWNVDGLISKFDDPEFVPYVESFAFASLCETFVESIDLSGSFRNHDVYVSPARKLSQHGRLSGGVICLVDRRFNKYFQRVHGEYDNIVIFRVDRILFGTDKDVLFCNVYIPPVSSPYYKDKDYDNGLDHLQKCLIEVLEEHGECGLILNGDLNARTGCFNVRNCYDIFDCSSDYLDNARNSQDSVLNDYGRALLAMCVGFDLYILNGFLSANLSGKCTYVSSSGRSVIDYNIVSKDILYICSSLTVHDSIASPHMSLELELQCTIGKKAKFQKKIMNSRIVWEDALADVYVNNLSIALQEAHVIDEMNDINAAVECISSCLVKAADFIKKMFVRNGAVSVGRTWYDKECTLAKRQLRRFLRKFLSTLSDADRLVYIKQRNEYKQLIRKKKQTFRQESTISLISSLREPKLFWKQIKNMTCRYVSTCNITPNEWIQHFQMIFSDCHNSESSSLINLPKLSIDHPISNCEYLNENISSSEIESAIKQLKTGKSAGPDGIISEMLKSSSALLLPLLVKLFNLILDSGQYPRSWRRSIIVPLHKRGDNSVPDNYRGISLTSTFSKVFLHVVHSRLQTWVNDNDIIVEEQAGFRRGYSTIDNIFVLRGVIDRYLSRHKKLFVAFIDFKKAFDSVNRDALWTILNHYGIKGKIVNVLKSMYDDVSSCVRCAGGLSEYFVCPNGLKQGCKCSPLLFSIIVNILALEVKKKSKHGVQLMPNTSDVVILLFADDIALMSDTVVGLQHQLNNLCTFAHSLGLVVNVQKSKTMVFRGGGHIAAHERWYIGDEKLETVNEYKYLGMTFSTKLSTNVALTELAGRAKAAVCQIFRSLRKLVWVSPEVFTKIFDAQVQPILLYAAEVWGSEDCNIVEKVHVYALKQFLNVAVKTPNVMVYGDTGRYPLYIGATMRMLKYWLKVLRMDKDRLPYRVYKMMMNNIETGANWAFKVREILQNNKMSHLWSVQRVDDETSFLCRMKECLVDTFKKTWRCKLQSSERYMFYREIKSAWEVENYLYVLDKKVFRDVFIRFRFGITEMYIHKCRYESEYQKLCPLCKEGDEDEDHFLFRCPVLYDLRNRYLVPHVHPENDVNIMREVLASAETCTIRAVATYLYYAFKRRCQAIEMRDYDLFTD